MARRPAILAASLAVFGTAIVLGIGSSTAHAAGIGGGGAGSPPPAMLAK